MKKFILKYLLRQKDTKNKLIYPALGAGGEGQNPDTLIR